MRVIVRWSTPRTGRTARRAFDRRHAAGGFATTRRRFWAGGGEDVAHVVKIGYLNRADIPRLAQRVALEPEPDLQPVLGIGERNRRQREAREARDAEREAAERARAAPDGG